MKTKKIDIIKLKNILNDFEDESQELLDFGNSNEKAKGLGIQEVIIQIKREINVWTIRRKEQNNFSWERKIIYHLFDKKPMF